MVLQRLFFVFLFFLSGTNIYPTEKLIIVTDQWAPYVYLEDETPRGFDYEVMKAVFDRMGYEFELQFYPWKRCIYMIENGSADAILDISKNAERLDKMYFPEQNISTSESVLFHLKNKHFIYNELSDLSGLRIGTVLGYEYNQDFLESKDFVREPVLTLEQNIKKLMLNRIDMFISNRNVGLFTALEMKVLDQITYHEKAITGGENYLAYSMRENNQKISEEFSETLKNFKETEEYFDILIKYGQ